jgi:hypothetical protein
VPTSIVDSTVTSTRTPPQADQRSAEQPLTRGDVLTAAEASQLLGIPLSTL